MTAERVEMIRQRLTEALEPESLDIEDDSASHFNVIIVSNKFNGQNLIKRHRMVYDAVADMMNKEIHALSMKTYTPDEF